MSMEGCPGFDLVLECSIIQGSRSSIATVFHGNLMNCSNSNNEITLLHSRLNQENRTCNNGKVFAYILPINDSGNCYTSLLCIMVTPDVAGRIVICSDDNGTTTQNIGNYSIPPNTTESDATMNPFTGNIHVFIICKEK